MSAWTVVPPAPLGHGDASVCIRRMGQRWMFGPIRRLQTAVQSQIIVEFLKRFLQYFETSEAKTLNVILSHRCRTFGTRKWIQSATIVQGCNGWIVRTLVNQTLSLLLLMLFPFFLSFTRPDVRATWPSTEECPSKWILCYITCKCRAMCDLFSFHYLS